MQLHIIRLKKKNWNPQPSYSQNSEKHTSSDNVNHLALKPIDGHRVTNGSMNSRYM